MHEAIVDALTVDDVVQGQVVEENILNLSGVDLHRGDVNREPSH